MVTVASSQAFRKRSGRLTIWCSVVVSLVVGCSAQSFDYLTSGNGAAGDSSGSGGSPGTGSNGQSQGGSAAKGGGTGHGGDPQGGSDVAAGTGGGGKAQGGVNAAGGAAGGSQAGAVATGGAGLGGSAQGGIAAATGGAGAGASQGGTQGGAAATGGVGVAGSARGGTVATGGASNGGTRGTGGAGTGGAPVTGGVSTTSGGAGAGGVSKGGSATGGAGTGGAATGGAGTGGAATGGAGTGGVGTGGAGTGGAATDPDLVLWYKFDDTAGPTVLDSSGNGRHGTLTTLGAGTAVYSTTHQVGTGALDLSSSSSTVGAYVVVPTNLQAMGASTAITIASWLQLKANPVAWQRVFDFGSSSTTTYIYLSPMHNLSTPNAPRSAISTAGISGENGIMMSTPAAVTTGVWHHFAVVLTAGSPYTGTLYIDKVAVGTNATMTLHPSDLSASTNNWLGRSQFAADPLLNGYLDDFRVYKRALTATEIATLNAVR